MQCIPVPSRIHRLSLVGSGVMDTCVALPTVRGTCCMKYGEHAYYFMNFRTSNGVCAVINHRRVIGPGLTRLKKAAARHGKKVGIFRCFSSQFHYGFNLLEQVMLMTVPHTITSVGSGRFIVNFWSWCGYMLVDCMAGTVTYCMLDEAEEDTVLGSQQWYDPDTGDLYAMSYSLSDSLARIDAPERPVSFRIFRHRLGEPGTETVWSGELSDYMHDILVNRTRQYCVACELGMNLDDKKDIVPSKVLVLDLKSGKNWVMDRFVVAAHACFDPTNPNVVYFSNHNFEFQHSNIVTLLKKGSYSVKFRGPASVFKYELTSDGPSELGVFTRADFKRLTNMHAFNHGGTTIIAAMGFPDEIFIIKAEDMSFIKKVRVKDPVSIKHLYSKKPALIGTIAPSPDGKKLFVQTTKSFQVVDIDSGEAEYVRDYCFSHICFNHMVAVSDTKW